MPGTLGAVTGLISKSDTVPNKIILANTKRKTLKTKSLFDLNPGANTAIRCVVFLGPAIAFVVPFGSDNANISQHLATLRIRGFRVSFGTLSNMAVP